MTESEYRIIFGAKIHDAMIEAKADAGKRIERLFIYNDNDELDESKYYAQLFDEVTRMVAAFSLEVAGSMR